VTHPVTPTIRPVRPQDVPAVVAMVHELAEYERAPDQCHLTDDQLAAALFTTAPALFGHVAVDERDEPVGFALWFRGDALRDLAAQAEAADTHPRD
jgi:hypothetical protein